MSKATVRELSSIISRLQARRQEHLNAISAIDALFQEHGITPSAPARRGRPRTASRTPAGRPPTAGVARGAAGGRRPRGKFETTATESILNFVSKAGKQGVLSSDVVKHWESEGRGATPFAALNKLVKSGKLRREELPGERGSRYLLPS